MLEWRRLLEEVLSEHCSNARGELVSDGRGGVGERHPRQSKARAKAQWHE